MPITQAEKFLQDNQLLMESPQKCDLKIGTLVVFTNESGISFPNLVVIGFAKPENQVGKRFIHVGGSSCPWFPCHRENLTIQGSDGIKEGFTVTYPNGKILKFKPDGTYEER